MSRWVKGGWVEGLGRGGLAGRAPPHAGPSGSKALWRADLCPHLCRSSAGRPKRSPRRAGYNRAGMAVAMAAPMRESAVDCCLSVSSARVVLGAPPSSKSRVAIAALSSQTQWAELCDYAWSWYSHNQSAPSAGSGPPSGQASLQLVINHHHRSSPPRPVPSALPPPEALLPKPSSTRARLPRSPPSAAHLFSLEPLAARPSSPARPPCLVVSALPPAAADWPPPGDPSAPSSPPKPPSGFSHHWPHLQLSHALFPRPSCSSAACTLRARPRPTSAPPTQQALL